MVLTRMEMAGLVLAGGLSRRMQGADKSDLHLAGTPLWRNALDRLAPQVSALMINANSAPDRFAGTGLPVLPDTISGHKGPLAGVLAGLRYAETHNAISHVVSVAVDTPFFPADLAASLAAQAGNDATIVIATSGGNRHPVFGLWPVACAHDLERWLRTSDTMKVMAFVGRHAHAFADFEIVDGRDPFFNINTPEDLATAGQNR